MFASSSPPLPGVVRTPGPQLLPPESYFTEVEETIYRQKPGCIHFPELLRRPFRGKAERLRERGWQEGERNKRGYRKGIKKNPLLLLFPMTLLLQDTFKNADTT
jgi:hypothetical protein